MPHQKSSLWQGHAQHPTVNKVRETGYLTVLDRERALSRRTPTDRSLAIVDAVGAKNAQRYKVAASMTRALRARYSLGPSGALLDKRIDYTQMDGRAALTLGWLKALTVRKAKQLRRAGTSIRDAGPYQLLAHAAHKLPNDQAPHLALALLEASMAPRRGAKACAAWVGVQQQARNGRRAAVPLAAAERAVAAVRRLSKSCKRKDRAPFSRPISLPAPAAESAAGAPRAGRQAGRPTKRSGDVYRKGVAFSAVAPLFKGYLDVALVRALIQRDRLDQIKLFKLMKTDQTGDHCVAALNAALWSRRLPPDRIAEVGWKTILRRRNLLSKRADAAALKLSALSAVEAVVLGYSRVVAGWGMERPELPGDPPAKVALPRQLFRHARGKLPMSASLGPIVAMLHSLDLHRQANLCAAAKRADSVAFVARKSQLPEATRRLVIAATDTIKTQCATLTGARK